MGSMKIRDKILALVLAFCFFSVLSLSLTFFVTERRLTEYLKEVNTSLIGCAAADARIAGMSNNSRFIFAIIIAVILLMVVLLAVWLTKIISEPIVYENAALEALNRMKTEYIGNFSHETKTPLTVISVHIQLAASLYEESGHGDPEITESLNRAQTEIMRVSCMNDNTLRLASMQAGDISMSTIDLSALLKNSVEAYRRFIENNGNTLTADIHEKLPAISGNADRLIQVMANLLTNANRHTENGVISVASAIEDGFVKVTVKDSGTGIAAEHLPKIFERGFSTSGSTGFGLNICKNTVESHGGKIRVEQGDGTTVLFTLPFAR